MTSLPAMAASAENADLPQLPATARGLAPLLQLARQTLASARASGALQPIHTECERMVDGGLPFSLRWISSLALKQAQGRTPDAADSSGSTRSANPFLPPDPRLCIATIGAHHRALLNKFPVIDDHLLLVTREFEAQTTPLGAADWTVLAAIVGAHGGLGFYNGGPDAGASQPHRHLQWVAQAAAGEPCALAAFSAGLDVRALGKAQQQPALPWRHVFVAVELDADRETDDGRQLRQAFLAACAALDFPADADPMPPCNLLLCRQWLLLVPRRCETVAGVSVNALGYAGSLFARDREHIERVRAHGPLALLQAAGLPR